MFSNEFLQMIRCPITHSALQLAESSVVDALNERIAQGSLKNRSGEKVERALDAGLVGEPGEWLYPVFDQIPQLIADEAISLSTETEGQA